MSRPEFIESGGCGFACETRLWEEENARAVFAVPTDSADLPGLPLLVDFAHPVGRAFGKRESSDGTGTMMKPARWMKCPEGYVFPGAYQFWFLANEELDAFVKTPLRKEP